MRDRVGSPGPVGLVPCDAHGVVPFFVNSHSAPGAPYPGLGVPASPAGHPPTSALPHGHLPSTLLSW